MRSLTHIKQLSRSMHEADTQYSHTYFFETNENENHCGPFCMKAKGVGDTNHLISAWDGAFSVMYEVSEMVFTPSISDFFSPAT